MIQILSSSKMYHSQIPPDIVTDYILGELQTNLKYYVYSQAQLEENLANASQLIGSQQLLSDYQQDVSLLPSLGYKDPKHFKVLINLMMNTIS